MHITKALVVDQPWIDLLLAGQKTWEMRSTATSQRGWFGLIRKVSGMVVGVADLVGVGQPLSTDETVEHFDKHRIPVEMIRSGAVAKWNTPWFLQDVRQLQQPVPYVHPYGAVTWVNLDESVTRAISAQFNHASRPFDARPAVEQPEAATPPTPVPINSQASTSREAAAFGSGPLLGEAELTEGNLKNNHFYLRAFLHRFPADLIGGSNRSEAADRAALVEWDGPTPIETDIDGQKQFFRARSWMKSFFANNDAQPGDRVRVEETAPYRYRVTLRKAGAV